MTGWRRRWPSCSVFELTVAGGERVVPLEAGGQPVASGPIERLRVATRGSGLARWQASWVARRLGDAELLLVSTEGDRRRDLPIGSLGGRGVFVKEVQQAVLDGRADLAVHSAKDLPAIDVNGLVVAAVPERADPRDVLVGSALAALGPGATVATGAPRRRAQLAWRRPDLTFGELRGNIETRLERIPAGGALVVALAALERLGLGDRASEVLATDVMLPQGGQGALALECRSDDEATRRLLAAIDHEPSRLCLAAERAFLAALGGGCDVPAGALATWDGPGIMRVEAVLASGDGRVLVRRSLSAPVTVGDVSGDHVCSGHISRGRVHGGKLARPGDRASAQASELGRSLALEMLAHCGGDWLIGAGSCVAGARSHPEHPESTP